MERLTERERNVDGTGVAKEEITDGLLKPFADKILTKLATYEDLEEQGLLVRLPCKLKDKLYHFYGIDLEDNFVDVISDEIIMEVVATEFVIDSYEIAIKCITDWNSPYEYLPAAEFGKTVFLTREEAEKKLEEMKKNGLCNKNVFS
jgi:hypothetical protein|nr:MAG TPA: hypothetical protein [Caudoviricetes sp.]